MYENLTVVINCAGMGTRLGLGSPKALLDICGKPLIIWQLDLLKNVKDIRIVVGYEAEKVIDVVTQFRKDIMFVFNYDYQSTGTGGSLSKGLLGTNEYIIAIDGDLIINPSDMKRILDYPDNAICTSSIVSDNPVYIQCRGNQAIAFSGRNGSLKWAGLVKIESKKLIPGNGYVYEKLMPVLPVDCLNIKAIDIDTFSDYEKAIKWVSNGFGNIGT